MNLSLTNEDISNRETKTIQDTRILEETEELTYEILTLKDKEEAKNLVAICFIDEPLTKLISSQIKKVTLTDFHEFIEFYLDEVCLNNLSVIAREKTTKKIVGVCFNMENNYLDSKPKGDFNAEIIFEPIIALIYYAWEIAYKTHPHLALNDTAIDIFQLALHPEWRGKKISNQLVYYSIQLIKNSGFKYAVCEATSFFTKKIMEKFNFECIYKQDVRYFEYNGKLIFKDQQPPHEEFTLWLMKFD